MNAIDDSAGIELGMATLLLIAALYVWTALALSAVFRKSGEERWKAWVPVLNHVVLLQLGWLSGWLYLLVLVPFVGPLIVWAVLIVACYRINLSFGHGAGMTVLAGLLLPVWASILGFGPARWLGSEPPASKRGAGQSRTPRLDPADEYAPRAAPPAYRPSLPFPSEAAGGWTPQPAPTLSSAVDSAAGPHPAAPVSAAPISAAPISVPIPDGPVPDNTGASPIRQPEVAEPPVTRRPADSSTADEDEAWAPARRPPRNPDATPGEAGRVPADPFPADAGTPPSGGASTPALHVEAGMPEEPIDATIITRRRRTAWSLVPPSGAAVPITSEVVLLGRKPAPDSAFPDAQLISIDDGTVSKTHACLALRDDRWYVTDLGSTNGVLFATLMGTEVEATPGDEVEAGDRFFLGDAEVRLQRSGG